MLTSILYDIQHLISQSKGTNTVNMCMSYLYQARQCCLLAVWCSSERELFALSTETTFGGRTSGVLV